MATGRPKQDAQQALSRHVGIRFTASDAARLEALAAAAGLSLSDYVRAAALATDAPRRRRQAGASRPNLTPDELAALNALGVDLRAIGNNANQIARALNGGADVLDSGVDGLAALGALADDLRPKLDAIFARFLA